MKESILYKVLRPIVNIYVKLILRPKYIGLDNIPINGKIILSGTHTNKLDAILLMSTTKRPIHFLAKKELWKFPYRIIFGHMGLIPVDRSKKSPDSLITAKKYLDSDKVVLIFPEGTLEKEKGKLLPFKIGTVKLAYETDTKIIPFAISGDYYKKSLRINFGKPIKINSDLDKENNRLKNIIENLRK